MECTANAFLKAMCMFVLVSPSLPGAGVKKWAIEGCPAIIQAPRSGSWPIFSGPEWRHIHHLYRALCQPGLHCHHNKPRQSQTKQNMIALNSAGKCHNVMFVRCCVQTPMHISNWILIFANLVLCCVTLTEIQTCTTKVLQCCYDSIKKQLPP